MLLGVGQTESFMVMKTKPVKAMMRPSTRGLALGNDDHSHRKAVIRYITNSTAEGSIDRQAYISLATVSTRVVQLTLVASLTEYATFLYDKFDPNQFVHAVVNNEPYPPVEQLQNGTEHQQQPSTDGATVNSSGFLRGLATTGTSVSNGNARNLGARDGVDGIGASGAVVDVSQALARLNFGVEDLNRQLKHEITKHHSSLLLQAASLGGLENDLGEVRDKLAQVETGVSNLRKKITVPYQSLASSLTLLSRLRRASSLARRASRFVVLARRLQSQMSDIEGVIGNGDARALLSEEAGAKTPTVRDRKDRAMAEAALTLAELDALLSVQDRQDKDDNETSENDIESTLPIQTLQIVAAHVPTVELSRRRVVEEMESDVQQGLDQLNNSILASSLQTAHNLSVLPALVEALVASLTDSVSRKVKAIFDMASIAREVGHKETTNAAAAFVYKSRTRNEPTTATMPAWSTALWTRLESTMTEIYTMEKVLKLKRDQTSQQTFLDEAMSVLENKPSLLFWHSLSASLENVTRDIVKTSPFIQTTFSTGYTRLLRLFQEFFSKIAVHSDTVYTLTQQSPETILVLRAIQPLESLYLTRSTNRLNESVATAFSLSSSSSFVGSSSSSAHVPTANEGLGLSRAIVNELDAARFDPLLVKNVAAGASKAIETFIAKSQALVIQDHSSISMLGPLATTSQRQNAALTSSLYHLWSPLNRSLNDHSQNVKTVMKPAVDNVRRTYLAIATPLILAIRRDFSNIISRMHRVDYGKSSTGAPGALINNNGGGPSPYMSDLTDKLMFVRDELLGSYKIGELGREWALDLARFTVQTFILHACIIQNLSEQGKLKLTSDVTSLEFAVSQYLTPFGLSLTTMGDQYKTLKAFRPLLFLDDSELASSSSTSDVPTLVLMHHIMSRSRLLRLPHQLGESVQTETEYVRWLNEHGDEDRVKVIQNVFEDWTVRRDKVVSQGVEAQEVEATDRMVELLKQLVGKM
ncbi:hypothetical protein OIO90_005193 [Microbotryomycetes sp. JL221]|nr:hypothetical protein OIO90_005193 [Microbotryomycetes sp. JL221]